MCICVRSKIVSVVIVLLALVLTPRCLQAQHPFLIVTEANYPTLRSLAAQSPWSNMKSAAISDVQSLNYNVSDKYQDKALRMTNIVSAGALAYILDPNNSSTYLTKVHDTMVNYWPDLRGSLANDFQYCVLPGVSFFNSVLALDVMYNGFTAAEVNSIETELQLVANWYNANNTSWKLNLYACRGIWAIYKDNRSAIDLAKNSYRSELMGQLTADGVYSEGPGYAGVRLSQERDSKACFMDVLEFTGEDNNYYSDSKIRTLMEWLYGYASTPFRKFNTFGDTAPNRNYQEKGPAVFRAYRFSEKAAKYAAWNNNGITPPGRLLHYVLMGQQLPAPEKAPSRIFPDGGAWFIEAGNSNRALSGALWNCMSEGWHSHKDVSAIHLAAYGEHVLRNSGYRGASQGALGFTWDYIHDDAISGNTVLVDGSDHTGKVGAGITEGFTAPMFDYASSDSGNALRPNGYHQRNFLFIRPTDDPCDGVNGYWILMDEVDADSVSSQVNVVLHPNSDNPTTVSADEEYKWRVTPYTYSGHDVYLSIFLGTAPVSTSIEDGLLARMADESACFVGEYLYSTYDTDGSGNRNIVTVLFPHDDTHAKATMTRISGGGYTGASIAQGSSVEDIALESTGTSEVTYNDLSFRGLAAWYRLEDGLLTSYFVRKGRSLDDGFVPRVGFESPNDVSIYVNDTAGSIISPNTPITFYHPDIIGVSMDGGSPLSNISSGTDWVQVSIPSGTHEMEFALWTIADFDTSGGVDMTDFAILASQWQQAPGIPSADVAPAGGDGIVDALDLAIFVDRWLGGVE